jgi:hypothetical protein
MSQFWAGRLHQLRKRQPRAVVRRHRADQASGVLALAADDPDLRSVMHRAVLVHDPPAIRGPFGFGARAWDTDERSQRGRGDVHAEEMPHAQIQPVRREQHLASVGGDARMIVRMPDSSQPGRSGVTVIHYHQIQMPQPCAAPRRGRPDGPAGNRPKSSVRLAVGFVITAT